MIYVLKGAHVMWTILAFIILLSSSTVFSGFNPNDIPVPSNLIYGDGSTQISSEINVYENITPDSPILGSVFITHNIKDVVDEKSFRIGGNLLKVEFVSNTSISTNPDIAVTIYKFQLSGMPAGTHTLPPITVKVEGKEYAALPMTVEVGT